MNYAICTTIDSGYVNESLVFYASLIEHNPQMKLTSYCINFTPEEFDDYSSRLQYFPNVTPVLISFTDDLDYIHLIPSEQVQTYAHHLHATIYKIKMFSEMEADYTLYFDVDMLVRKDISNIFREYKADFAGACYWVDPHITTERLNAGVLIARKGMTNLYDEMVNYLSATEDVVCPEEVFIQNSLHSRIYIERTYNYHYLSGRLHEFVPDPHIVHFTYSKPWKTLRNDIQRSQAASICAFGIVSYMNEWYQTANRIQHILKPEYVKQIEFAKRNLQPYIDSSHKFLSKLRGIYSK